MTDLGPDSKGGKQRVVRVDQSPMNAGIWVLQLACGHDVYKSQRSRPSLVSPRYLACEKCRKREAP